MDNIENTLNCIKEKRGTQLLSDDFENRVFSKIQRKKVQRKMATSAALLVAVFCFIYIAGGLIFDGKQVKPMMASGNEIALEKEEVPVMEDVIFASSDAQTNYAIQQVAHYNEEDTI
ncbi:MAG: hypothetical protein GY765_31655 [bacterium]|nr:hypothetical protein [bacterium]